MNPNSRNGRTATGTAVRLVLLCVVAPLPLTLSGCGPKFESPTRIGVTDLDLSPLPPFLPKRILFQRDLETELDGPVVFDLMSPRQIRVHLGTGRAAFAMVSAADFSQIAASDNYEILAVPTNLHGQTSRRGLIVVSAKSSIQSLADLKHRRFHFLPAGDVLNEAALGALMESGLSRQDLDHGILGLELDTSHISSLEVAKSVVLEDAAGIIDEADYNDWPEKGGSLVLLTPSKDQVRIIGETVRVPEGPFLASRETPADVREQVKRYLTEELKAKVIVLGVLGVSGFAEPIDVAEYEPYFALHRKLSPAGPPASEPTSRPALSSR